MTSFFLPGNSRDPAYRNVRDLPLAESSRDYVERLWQKYKPYADRNFLTDAKEHFQQRFWEMYLCLTFIERGFSVEKHSSSGPEFSVLIDGQRYWVEAIAPTAGTAADAVPSIEHGRVFDVPEERVVLRFSSAIADKLKKYESDLTAGRVASSDGFILGINSVLIPHAPLGSTIPYYVKACLPIGHLTIPINTQTREHGEAFYSAREFLRKQNAAEVATTPLLSKNFAGFSAVLHSGVDCANTLRYMGSDFDFLLNPLAKVPLKIPTLNWATVRYVDGDQLYRIDPPDISTD